MDDLHFEILVRGSASYWTCIFSIACKINDSRLSSSTSKCVALSVRLFVIGSSHRHVHTCVLTQSSDMNCLSLLLSPPPQPDPAPPAESQSKAEQPASPKAPDSPLENQELPEKSPSQSPNGRTEPSVEDKKHKMAFVKSS